MPATITAKALLDDPKWGKVAYGLTQDPSDPIAQSFRQGGSLIGSGATPDAHTVSLSFAIDKLNDQEIVDFFQSHGLSAAIDRKDRHINIAVEKDQGKAATTTQLFDALVTLRSMLRGPMVYKDSDYKIFLGFRGNDDEKATQASNAARIKHIQGQFREFGIEMKQAGEIECTPGTHAPTTQDSPKFYDQSHVKFLPADKGSGLALEKLEARVSSLKKQLSGDKSMFD